MKPIPPLQLIAAPFTPFREDGEIACDRIPAQAEFLRGRGVSGVFVGGTTGEGLSLTLDERKRLTLAWRAAAGGLSWFVHVGHACVADARELARHAEEAGAPAIAAIGPVFFPVATARALSDYCRAIAAAAPRTPFYYYHMPSMARVGVAASEAMRLLIDEVPTFAGIKFTHEDLDDYRRCLALGGGRYPVLFGRDELFLEGLRAGATGAVGSTYNFAAPLYREIARAWRAGETGRAERLQALCTGMIGRAVAAGGLPAIKEIHALAGFDCGPVRPPLQNLSEGDKKRLGDGLRDLAFFAELEACHAL